MLFNSFITKFSGFGNYAVAIEEISSKPGMEAIPVIPALRLSTKNHVFKANLDYIVRPCLRYPTLPKVVTARGSKQQSLYVIFAIFV